MSQLCQKYEEKKKSGEIQSVLNQKPQKYLTTPHTEGSLVTEHKTISFSFNFSGE